MLFAVARLFSIFSVPTLNVTVLALVASRTPVSVSVAVVVVSEFCPRTTDDPGPEPNVSAAPGAAVSVPVNEPPAAFVL